jgi:dephospho-CoA kinase
MNLVQISGMPATGKTTGARFLDPKKTYYIDADGKGLSWKG